MELYTLIYMEGYYLENPNHFVNIIKTSAKTRFRGIHWYQIETIGMV